MSESDTASVECPLCEEAFDPTAAGGWCTNSECGEWQYEADVTPDQQSTTEADGEAPDSADGSVDEPSDVDEHADQAADGDAATEPETDSPSDEASDDSDGADGVAESPTDDVPQNDGTEDDAAETPEDDAAEPGPADDEADESEPGDSESVDSDSADAGAEDVESDEATTFDCPGCGTELDADVNFCPTCGEDVSNLPGDGAGDELDACPSCGTDVGPDDNFCAACGEDLDAHRGGEPVLDACPDCGADVDEDQRFCASCGADLDAHRDGEAGGDSDAATDDSATSSDDAATPDALALAAHGRSVVVEDGDAVGREIRSLLTDAGRPEDEAVRIHREHVRFVREGGQFYVVALGKNPTVVNGTSLAQGDREPVEPGDELSLSDVVTLAIEAA